MNANISVFVIYVKVIIYWLLFNLHDCSFNLGIHFPALLGRLR